MHLASVSSIGPAVARIGRRPIFAGTIDLRYAVGATVTFVLALAAYDLVVRRRVHWVTAVGGTFRVALLVCVYTLGQTEFMQALMRRIA